MTVTTIFLSGQIHSAMAYISEMTGRGSADLDNPVLRSAGVLLVRQLYDGYREIRPTEAFYGLIAPFRSYRPGTTAGRLVLDPVVEDHTRYFGWSDDRVISTADFAGASKSTSDAGTLPQRSTAGYIWFAVPVTAGYPNELHLNDGPIDQLSIFVRQVDAVDDENGVPHIVAVRLTPKRRRWAGKRLNWGIHDERTKKPAL